ncbi:MAG: hypothetical protein M1838_001389 [Thelocarpon superellum]|nr:MAG: hypothetical protein M1838_001389 [Thelocarpon superellum]
MSSEIHSSLVHSSIKLPPRRAQKIKEHYRRFWYFHLVGAVVGLVTFILLVLDVFFPHLAQAGVDSATIEVTAMALTNPTPTSFDLYQHQILHSDSPFQASLDGFNASLFLPDLEPNIIPFAYVQVPGMVARDGLSVSLVQTIQIADMDQFARYSAIAFKNDTYTLGISGRPLLHLGGFPATYVNFNHVLSLKGLNNLRGFNVTQTQILLSPASDGANMLGIVYVPNPSPMTVQLGNLTMDLFVEKDLIGTSTIENLTIMPGNNTVEMRATVNQSLVLEKTADFPSGVLPIDAVGKSVTFHGQHLPYFEKSLAATAQHIELNVTATIGKLLGN